MSPDNFRLDALHTLRMLWESKKEPQMCEDFLAMLLFTTWQSGVIHARTQILARKEAITNEAASVVGLIAADMT